jgi:hypothetical protein
MLSKIGQTEKDKYLIFSVWDNLVLKDEWQECKESKGPFVLLVSVGEVRTKGEGERDEYYWTALHKNCSEEW